MSHIGRRLPIRKGGFVRTVACKRARRSSSIVQAGVPIYLKTFRTTLFDFLRPRTAEPGRGSPCTPARPAKAAFARWESAKAADWYRWRRSLLSVR